MQLRASERAGFFYRASPAPGQQQALKWPSEKINDSCTVAERVQSCTKSERAQRAALLNWWACFLPRGFCVCPELWECLCKLTQSTGSSLQLFRLSRFSIPKDGGH